jgi:hypothetical protein
MIARGGTSVLHFIDVAYFGRSCTVRLVSELGHSDDDQCDYVMLSERIRACWDLLSKQKAARPEH